MRQELRDERRRTIAAAVARLAAAEGVGGVSLRTVAAESGASMGQIQHHFSTVANLLHASVEQLLGSVEARIEQATADVDGADLLKEHALALLSDDPELTLALRAYAQLRTAAPSDSRIADLIADFDARRREALTTAIELGRKRRLLHKLVEPERSADLFWTLLLSLAIEVAQGLRDRQEATELMRYEFRTMARNAWVTRPR